MLAAPLVTPLLVVAMVAAGVPLPSLAPALEETAEEAPVSVPFWTDRSVPTNRALHTVHFHNETHGWAGADDGVLYLTRDGGVTWHVRHTGLFYPLQAMEWVDGTTGWVGTVDRAIARSTDGGDTWEILDKGGVLGDFTDFHFLDADRGFATGRSALFYGYLLRTEDGGETWTTGGLYYPRTESSFRMVEFSEDGEQGWVLTWIFNRGHGVSRSTDGGRSWEFFPIADSGAFLDLAMATDEVGVAVGELGQIYRTTDGGLTWAAVVSPTAATLLDVDFLDAQRGWAVGEQGTVLATTDGGMTWTPEFSGTASPLGAAAFTPGGHGWTAGAAGEVRYRREGDALASLVEEVVPLPPGNPSPPLLITGDEGFASPLSGVRGGSGTPEDPYVIEGYDIVPTTGDGITLAGTTAHVVIRGNRIHDSTQEHAGIRLTNARNVVIEGNRIEATAAGVAVAGGDGITLRDNEILKTRRNGIDASAVTNLRAEDNLLQSSASNGIQLANVPSPFVTGNTLAFNTLAGIRLQGQTGLPAAGGLLQGNLLQDNREGIRAVNVRDAQIEGNLLMLAMDHGINLQRATNVLVQGNVFLANADSEVRVGEESVGTRVVGNDVRARTTGILLRSDTDSTVRANVIRGGDSGAIETSGSRSPLIEENRILSANMAIRVGDATTGAEVLRNHAEPVFFGIWVTSQSTDNLVANNTVTSPPDHQALGGIAIMEYAHRNVIRGNDVSHMGGTAISVAGWSTDALVEENRVSHAFRAVDVVNYAERAIVRGNHGTDLERGIDVYRRADDALVERNTLVNVTGAAFTVGSSSRVVHRDNVVLGAATAYVSEEDCPIGAITCDSVDNVLLRNTLLGLSVEGVEVTDSVIGRTINLTVTLNRLEGSGTAIRLDGTESFAASANNLDGFAAGLSAARAGAVEAAGNWWGAADGPSGLGPGSGAAVTSDAGSRVTFAPWLTEPHAEAGAAL